MDQEPADRIRAAADVARRALALFSVVGVSFGAKREQVLPWLAGHGLSAELSPLVAAFLDEPAPSERQLIDATWNSERLIVLLWALGLADMPEADAPCDPSLLQELLPPYAEASVEAFVGSARLKPEPDLLAMAHHLRDLHAEARHARLDGREPRSRVHEGIVQERHHAINWVIGHEGLAWDEVTTDT
jgi:hypothetical protein